MDVVNLSKNDSMGLIVSLNKNNVTFDRIQFSNEEILEERWNINFPINASNFIYKFNKMNKKIKPFFYDKNRIKIKKINLNYNIQIFIIFNAALHQEYVYKYKIVLIILESFQYFNFYFNNL